MTLVAAERATEAQRFPVRLIQLENGIEFAGIKIGFGLDKGREREDQQDNVGVFAVHRLGKPPQLLAILADGIGGNKGGETASEIAVQTIATHYASYLGKGIHDTYALAWAILDADHEIKQIPTLSEAEPPGTTLSIVLLDTATGAGKNIRIGDSRTYVLDADAHTPTHLTVDQSEVAKLVMAGKITYDEIYDHDERNIILRFLGDREPKRALTENDLLRSTNTIAPPHVFVRDFQLVKGQKVVACSDGLWGMVRDAHIHQIVTTASRPTDAVETLIAAANANGGEDNMSVIVLEGPTPSTSPIEKPRSPFYFTEVVSGETVGDFSVGHGKDIGQIKPTQQDEVKAYKIERPGYAAQLLTVLADGVGGYGKGDVASSLATTSLPERFVAYKNQGPCSDEEAFALALRDINAALSKLPKQEGKKYPPSTTLVATLISADGNVLFARFGDSRLQIISENGNVRRVTLDQSQVEAYVREGIITEETRFTHPERNLIFGSLPALHEVTGKPIPLQVGDLLNVVELGNEQLDMLQHVGRVHIHPGERLLLSSDGLHGIVRDAEIGHTALFGRQKEQLQPSEPTISYHRVRFDDTKTPEKLSVIGAADKTHTHLVQGVRTDPSQVTVNTIAGKLNINLPQPAPDKVGADIYLKNLASGDTELRIFKIGSPPVTGKAVVFSPQQNNQFEIRILEAAKGAITIPPGSIIVVPEDESVLSATGKTRYATASDIQTMLSESERNSGVSLFEYLIDHAFVSPNNVHASFAVVKTFQPAVEKPSETPRKTNPRQAVEGLLAAANAHGGDDNISAILVEHHPKPLTQLVQDIPDTALLYDHARIMLPSGQHRQRIDDYHERINLQTHRLYHTEITPANTIVVSPSESSAWTIANGKVFLTAVDPQFGHERKFAIEADEFFLRAASARIIGEEVLFPFAVTQLGDKNIVLRLTRDEYVKQLTNLADSSTTRFRRNVGYQRTAHKLLTHLKLM